MIYDPEQYALDGSRGVWRTFWSTFEPDTSRVNERALTAIEDLWQTTFDSTEWTGRAQDIGVIAA